MGIALVELHCPSRVFDFPLTLQARANQLASDSDNRRERSPLIELRPSAVDSRVVGCSMNELEDSEARSLPRLTATC